MALQSWSAAIQNRLSFLPSESTTLMLQMAYSPNASQQHNRHFLHFLSCWHKLVYEACTFMITCIGYKRGTVFTLCTQPQDQNISPSAWQACKFHGKKTETKVWTHFDRPVQKSLLLELFQGEWSTTMLCAIHCLSGTQVKPVIIIGMLSGWQDDHSEMWIYWESKLSYYIFL